MYREVMGDVFRIEKGAIAHCITSDYSLGAGLAKDLDEKYDLKSTLLNIGQNIYPDCLLVENKDLNIFNLVTKKDRSDHPTYENLEESLLKLKEQMIEHDINTVYIPQIGCGKDRLDWKKVKPILQKIFGKDKKVDVCVLLYIPVKRV
jgi:Predicted phosphatase homologous to the C-terminal domain of histone macroH2A1